jgi:alpha-ketoglutarate-dependent taurine dioxygenase
VPKSPDSILSLTDFNGQPLSNELLHSSFGSLMKENGYVFMVNVPEEFDPVAFCKELGSFVPQYTGVVVGDIRPEEGMDDVYHSGNTKSLLPHSEGYDFLGLPPRYLALWCVTPALGAGGETTLCDFYRWVDTLTEEERETMRERVYKWKTTDGVIRMGLQLSTEHPLLEEHPEGLIVRFSYNNLLRDGDEFVAGILERGKAFFEQEHVAIDYDRGDMLVWDNWRMLHARNAFTDRGRHLKRIQIGLGVAARNGSREAVGVA